MSLNRLKWLTIVLPIAFMGIFITVTGLVLEPALGRATGHLVAGAISAVAVVLFSSAVFKILADMHYEILRRERETRALYEIGLHITSLQEIQTTLRSIVEQAREMLGSDTASLCLAQEEDQALTLAACSGPSEAFRRQPAPFLTLPLTLLPLPPGGPLTTDDPPCSVVAEAYNVHHLSAPLRVGSAMMGELCVTRRTPQGFEQRQRELLAGLADLAAIAINNVRLLERERQVAVLEERERLSREMHDSLAQVLGYLHLKAEATKRVLSRGDEAKAKEELEDMASLAHDAYVDVREAILGLRETVSPEMGIIGTLREYLQKFSRQAGIRADLVVEGESALPLPPEVEVQLIRVIQEALTNVRKHAHAQRSWVRISRHNGGVTICVEDNGLGFDVDSIQREGFRFGLRTMRERIERVGGQLQIESSPGKGTKVKIHIPLAEEDGNGTRKASLGRRSDPV